MQRVQFYLSKNFKNMASCAAGGDGGPARQSRVLRAVHLERMVVVNSSDEEAGVSSADDCTEDEVVLDDNSSSSSGQSDESDDDTDTDGTLLHAAVDTDSGHMMARRSGRRLQCMLISGRATALNVIRDHPGPTRYAHWNCNSVKGSFLLFFRALLREEIFHWTNAMGGESKGRSWKDTDDAKLQKLLGVLLLIGVYKSKNEDARQRGALLIAGPSSVILCPIIVFRSW